MSFAGSLCSGERVKGSKHDGRGWTEAGHNDSDTGTVVDGGEAATVAIGAKGGPFPLIGITGRMVDSMAVTIQHGGVYTMTRCVAKGTRVFADMARR